jgi:Tfp pilus assembly protein PilF
MKYVIAALIVIAVIALIAWLARRYSTKTRIAKADEHRARATEVEVAADRKAAEAEARAARARQEALEADREMERSREVRAEAIDLHDRADSVDPRTDTN